VANRLQERGTADMAHGQQGDFVFKVDEVLISDGMMNISNNVG